MFRPLSMKFVVVQVLTDDLPAASLALAESGSFHPDGHPEYREWMPGVAGERYRELFRQAEARLEKIGRQLPLALQPEIAAVREIGLEELSATNAWLGQVWQRCSSAEEALRDLQEEERMVLQLEGALHNFADLDIDLGHLQREKRFLESRIGTVARDNLGQLRGALELAGFLLYPYLQHEESAHVIIVGPKHQNEQELDQILDTAGFRHLQIPPELQAAPESVRQELTSRRQRIAKERQQIHGDLKVYAEQHRERLQQVQVELLLARPYAEVDQASHTTGALSVLTGWIPAVGLATAQAALRARLRYPFQLTARDPLPEELRQVPSHSPQIPLLHACSLLVAQYGVPRYREIDPTPIFAVSFIIMFGMMFGDIGHGLSFIVIALLLRRLLRSFTTLAVLAGISSALFGVLYGSLFGYHILPALWVDPLSDALYMLTVALFWGIGFLVVMSLLSIYNRVVIAHYGDALFGTNGAVSLLFYLSLLVGLYNLTQQGSFGPIPTTLAIISLVLLLSYKLIEAEAPPAERIMMALVETFEILTGYLSNTLSFLRVAAFSLNHVALAVAVFALADRMDGAGHWAMIIFGNLFIMILEGAIVTIQALRLEYYEGFSRFYSGDGRRFRPLRLGRSGGS